MHQNNPIQLQPVPSPTALSLNSSAKDMPSKPKHAFFIFVNPTSGGNKAAILTKLDVEKLIFSTTFNPNGNDIEANFYNLKDATSRNTGLQALKDTYKDESISIKVIVGGGDGTIMWVIEEMIRAGIPFDRCPIGCIPFGTGNDFSRVLGWGGQEPSVLIGTHLNNLKGMITQWVNAVTRDFDIWDITFEVHEEGGIRRVHKEDGKKFEKRYIMEKDTVTGQEKKVMKFTKKMCNYYSFGIDARIGYGFDKSRTTSRGLNKMVYCWEGFKKMFIKTFKVNGILHRVQSYKVNEQDIQTNQNQEKVEHLDFTGEDFVLHPSNHGEPALQKGTIIKGDPSVFLCLNIPSYMGGASNPWASSKGKLGVTDHEKKNLVDFEDQKFGDSKLEMISFSGPGSLALERFIPGQGRRVGQVEGPFVFNFKRNEDRNKPLSTYMQIDGEFFQLLAPKCVHITLAKNIPNGKVKVLMNGDKLKKK